MLRHRPFRHRRAGRTRRAATGDGRVNATSEAARLPDAGPSARDTCRIRI
jgi:hypothetical protein